MRPEIRNHLPIERNRDICLPMPVITKINRIYSSNKASTQVVLRAIQASAASNKLSLLTNSEDRMTLRAQSLDDSNSRNADSFLEPLIYSNATDINLNNIGSTPFHPENNLENFIVNLCHLNNIQYPSGIKAEFRSAVVLLPGKHRNDDPDCLNLPVANFIPTFKSRTKSNVIALVHTIDEFKLVSIDHREHTTSLICNNISNLVCNISTENESINKKMKKLSSPHLITFIEYQPVADANSVKVVTHISVYILDSHILNRATLQNCGTILGKLECEKIITQMQERANELNNSYLPIYSRDEFSIHPDNNHEYSNYENLLNNLDSHLSEFKVNCRHSNILQKAFCWLAGINKFDRLPPTPAKLQGTSTHLNIEFSLSSYSSQKLEWNLNWRDKGFCKYLCEQRNLNHLLEFPLPKVWEHLDIIKQAMQEVLADERTLLAYQKYSKQEKSQHNDFCQIINSMLDDRVDLKKEKIVIDLQKTMLIENVLSNMFSNVEKGGLLTYSQHPLFIHNYSTLLVQPGSNEIDNMLSTYFFLEMSGRDAHQLAVNINHQCKNSAILMSAKASLPFSAKEYSVISIENSYLLSEDFISAFSIKLANMTMEELKIYQVQPLLRDIALLKPSAANQGFFAHRHIQILPIDEEPVLDTSRKHSCAIM